MARTPPRAEAAQTSGAARAVAAAATSEESEYDVKAAFLLHFIRYTTFPAASFEDDASPIVVNVIGKDPFGPALENTFRDKEAHGRKLRVVRAREVPEHVTGHVAFCAELSKSARAVVLSRCEARPLLVIGEVSGFALEGAAINFYLQDNKTRFEINPDAVSAAGLEISPAVLKLARIVRAPKDGR